MLPILSAATSKALLNVADVAAPPSPEYPKPPVPANVLMIPRVFTLLTFTIAAIYKFPFLSKHKPFTAPSLADVAKPPSPVVPNMLPPAIVVMMPLVSIFLTA